MKNCLQKALNTMKTKFAMKETDSMRGKKNQNLLSGKLQDSLIRKVMAAEFDIVISSPPCSTFSRARTANSHGPPPLCSHRYPRGFPWLSRGARSQVNCANRLVDFSAKILEAQIANGTGYYVVLEHPENLGKRENQQRPASIWQWPALRELAAKPGVC